MSLNWKVKKLQENKDDNCVTPPPPLHLLFLCLLPEGICAEVQRPQHFKDKSECWTFVVAMFICSECIYYAALKADVCLFLITNLIYSFHRIKIYFCFRQNKIASFSPFPHLSRKHLVKTIKAQSLLNTLILEQPHDTSLWIFQAALLDLSG